MEMIIKDLIGLDVLSGAVNGKKAFTKMIALTATEPAEPQPVFINFAGVELATASFLRESAVALKTYKRAINSKFYPIVANIGAGIDEELEILMMARGDAMVACNRNKKGHVSNIRLIGDLDPKQAVTFKLVSKLPEADAGSLMEKYGAAERTTSTTAWNNRLSALVSRGLLREFTRGRSKFYRPLVEESA